MAKDKLKNWIRPEVLKQHGYSLKPFPQAIKLNQNELPYDLPEPLKERLLKRLMKVPFQRYPLTQPVRLKQALARRLKVSSEQIQVCNGSNVLIQSLLLMSVIHGKIMTVDPTFSVYEIEAELLGNRVVKVPLESDFSLSLSKFLRAVQKEKPALIFLPNPNAPTGNLFSTEDLLAIVKAASGLVVVDEAYLAFSKKTLLPYVKHFSNLIILQTFSKGFGLGGLRIGYAVASKALSEQLSKVLLPYCLSVLSEEIALFALENEAHYKKIRQEVILERDRMYFKMKELSDLKVFASCGNFLLFQVNSAANCFQYLLKGGVLVRNVSNHTRLKDCLRVSVGTRNENDQFLKLLGNYLKSQGKAAKKSLSQSEFTN